MGGDPAVIGRSITLDGVAHTIVGVLPNLPFSWIGPNAEIWTTKPFMFPGLSYERVMRGSGFLRVIGRLKPGMTIDQARAALPPLEQSYRAQYPGKIDSSSVMTLKTLPEDVTGNLRPAFATLLAAVAFVLLMIWLIAVDERVARRADPNADHGWILNSGLAPARRAGLFARSAPPEPAPPGRR